MRNECRQFNSGHCTYGRNCRFLHIKKTPLLDPPPWIHSSVEGVATQEIHPIEARLRFEANPMTYKEEWDALFVYNYSAVLNSIDTLVKDCQLTSLSDRYVDFRDERNLCKFVPVFDKQRVFNGIKKNYPGFGVRTRVSDHRRDGRYDSGRVDSYNKDFRDTYHPKKSYSDDGYGSRDSKFNYKNYPRDNRSVGDGYSRDDNYRRDNRYSVGDNRYSPSNNRYSPSDNRYSPSDGYSKIRDYKYTSSNYSRDSKYASSNYGRDNKYQDRTINVTTENTTKDDLTRDDIYIDEFVTKEDEFDI